MRGGRSAVVVPVVQDGEGEGRGIPDVGEGDVVRQVGLLFHLRETTQTVANVSRRVAATLRYATRVHQRHTRHTIAPHGLCRVRA